MFSTPPKANLYFLFTFKLLSANASDLDRSKILSFGKELIDWKKEQDHQFSLYFRFLNLASVISVCGKNVRGKFAIGKNVRGKIAIGKDVRAKVVKIS